MMAKITEIFDEQDNRVVVNTTTQSLSLIKLSTHNWLVDSAATSHLCGNVDLFECLYPIHPITIETSSGDVFTAKERGTINIVIYSDPSTSLPDLPITLLNVIYVLKLNANLLSVGRMTQADVNVSFYKNYSSI